MALLDISSEGGLQSKRGDVVVCVPLYGAHEHFVRCLQSLLAHTPLDITILIADDRTPDPASRALVEELEASGVLRHRIAWLARPENAGFVDNVNGAFAAAAPADVVIVNSDVVVADGWIAGMRDAAESDSTVATVTALTNHGTLVSVPERNQPVPSIPQDTTLDDLALAVRRNSLRLRPRLPVAIGHCVLVRRAALELVGDFDLAFAPGYGEEVDFSQRCVRMGLQHVVADDVLVAHHGGGSFDALAHRTQLQDSHEAMINARYPYYADVVLEAATNSTGPLARSVAQAAREFKGLRVTIDGRALGPYLTGTQVHALELIAALARTGEARVRVMLPDDPGGYVEPALGALDKVELVAMSEIDVLPIDDVVHRPWQVDRLQDLELLMRLGRRIVLTQQDLIAYHNPSYFPRGRDWLAYRRLTGEALAMSALTLFFSHHAREDAISEDLTSRDLSRVVYIGTDHRVSLQRPTPAPPAGRPLGDRPFLLCLGTDFRHKNRPFALRVLAALRERHGWGGRLVLAGPRVSHGSSSSDEAAFRAAHPELEDFIVGLPAVREAEKAWLLQHCAAVLYPTTYEGFGLVPFEAAEAGRPCIFAPQASLAEVLDDDAALIVPWNAAATADRMIDVLTDPDAAAAQLARVNRASERFSWDDTGAGLIAAYGEALAAPARSSLRLNDSEVLESRYWGLRNGIGDAGLSLVHPQHALLPKEAQRGLAALVRRPGTRQMILAPLRLAGRFGRTSRANRKVGDNDIPALPPGA